VLPRRRSLHQINRAPLGVPPERSAGLLAL
jgi:hypothetical protein